MSVSLAQASRTAGSGDFPVARLLQLLGESKNRVKMHYRLRLKPNRKYLQPPGASSIRIAHLIVFGRTIFRRRGGVDKFELFVGLRHLHQNAAISQAVASNLIGLLGRSSKRLSSCRIANPRRICDSIASFPGAVCAEALRTANKAAMAIIARNGFIKILSAALTSASPHAKSIGTNGNKYPNKSVISGPPRQYWGLRRSQNICNRSASRP